MMIASENKTISRFSSVDWGSVRGQFRLTDPEDGGGDGAGNGTSNGTAKGLDDAASDRYASSESVGSSRSSGGSKGRPKRPSRVLGNINNLVVDDDSDDANDAGTTTGTDGATAGRRRGRRRFLLVGGLVVLFIVYVVVVVGEVIFFRDGRRHAGEEEQGRLLEIAEEVVKACSDQNLANNSTECKELCKDNMCCFLEGEDSCVDDEDRETECAVYGGCEALVDEEVRLFLLSQDIVDACSEPQFSENEDDCDSLCFHHLCCFVSGEFSCIDDEDMTCGVYAGCEALVPEVTWN